MFTRTKPTSIPCYRKERFGDKPFTDNYVHRRANQVHLLSRWEHDGSLAVSQLQTVGNCPSIPISNAPPSYEFTVSDMGREKRRHEQV